MGYRLPRSNRTPLIEVAKTAFGGGVFPTVGEPLLSEVGRTLRIDARI